MKSFWRISFLSLALAGIGPAGAATYHISPAGSDTGAGSSAAPWRTLQKAAATMRAGDTALIADGEYPGGIEQTRAGSAGSPITFRAVNPGGAVVRGDQTTARDAFYVNGAHHVVVEGLTVRAANRSGIRVSMANFVTVRRCTFANNARWGIFTDYSDDLLLEYNECSGSAIEHGIYVSNSGDRPVIRFNTVHDNNASGIQINADPLLLEPSLGKRGDGITENAVIEANVVYNNGTAGGAAINLASVRAARIVNNLLYNNRAGGITGWDDGAGNQWGSRDNLVLHNTIYFRNTEGRWCVSFKNGSTNNTVRNNVLRGGARGALEYDNDSSILSDYNLMDRYNSAQVVANEDATSWQTLAQWQTTSGNDMHSRDADPLFVRPTTTPFDFHVQTGSPALDTGVTRGDVPFDLEGVRRPGGAAYDVGCYERGTAATARHRIAVFRPSTREWFVRADDARAIRIPFGGPDDTPVPADYDGRRRAQVAVYRRTTGEWFLRSDAGETSRLEWGTVGDLPVPADYQGTGRAQLAIYRPSTGEWFVRRDDGSVLRMQWGGPGDVPVPGNFLGLGRAVPAVYRPATAEWFIRNDNGSPLLIQWGTRGDLPVPGDHDGSGRARVAIYRPSTGEWFVRREDGTALRTPWGGPGDVPVSGDYLGLGRAVPTVFRPGSAEWFIRNDDGSPLRIQWGGPEDVPMPAGYAAGP
jgi:parallel beta-helix repeat protein